MAKSRWAPPGAGRAVIRSRDEGPIPVQLSAYYAAVLKGTDIDQPRKIREIVTDGAQRPLCNRISTVEPVLFFA